MEKLVGLQITSEAPFPTSDKLRTQGRSNRRLATEHTIMLAEPEERPSQDYEQDEINFILEVIALDGDIEITDTNAENN